MGVAAALRATPPPEAGAGHGGGGHISYGRAMPSVRPSDAITQTPFEPLSAIKRDGKKVDG